MVNESQRPTNTDQASLVESAFQEYMEAMAEHPAYAGMPDLLNVDGSIQWEAPSNRKSGANIHTHTKRTEWWKNKALEIGIVPGQSKWISRTAKAIHPTGKKPCKTCGQTMLISYAYPSKATLKKIRTFPELREVADDRFADIYAITLLIFSDTADPNKTLNTLLKNSKFPSLPEFSNVEEAIEWIKNVYAPSEPRSLSPGAMSNAPDRFDGFHSINLCCREKSDSGRSRENLASYTTDRRVYENWSNGNWVAANLLMGEIRRNTSIQSQPCSNHMNVSHSGVITADHIGPISLGFAHQPVFRLLCESCNSAKNNRITFEDVQNLRLEVDEGHQVTSWYNDRLWKDFEESILGPRDAQVFYALLRDNRSIAFDLLGEIFDAGFIFSLSTLLTPEVAKRKWNLSRFHIENGVIKGSFTSTPSNTKYRLTQQERMIRVSFTSLVEYKAKTNRHRASQNSPISLPSAATVLKNAEKLEAQFPIGAASLNHLLNFSGHTNLSGYETLDTRTLIEEQAAAKKSKSYIDFKSSLEDYMGTVAERLIKVSSMNRYTRELPPDTPIS